MVSTIGFVVLAVSMVPFLVAVVQGLGGPRTVGSDPWHANSLEWATTSPPPEHNFTWLPPIRSERPVFDLRWINYDKVGASGQVEAWEARQEHDDHWLPIHMWSRDPEEEPTAEHRPVIPDHDGGPTEEKRE